MNNSNYTLFEIIKYKIEFLECLEYSLISNTSKKEEIERHLSHLNEEYSNGLYNEITSTLFTSFNLLNKPINNFLKKYNINKITKLLISKKLKDYVAYNTMLIEAYETFNYIISAFTEEESIITKLDKRILNLIDISNTHFINFLFYNSINLYINSQYEIQDKLKSSRKVTKKLIGIIYYCNNKNNYKDYIEILKIQKTDSFHDKLEELSNICIASEKKQYELINEIVEFINNEIKNKQL